MSHSKLINILLYHGYAMEYVFDDYLMMIVRIVRMYSTSTTPTHSCGLWTVRTNLADI